MFLAGTPSPTSGLKQGWQESPALGEGWPCGGEKDVEGLQTGHIDPGLVNLGSTLFGRRPTVRTQVSETCYGGSNPPARTVHLPYGVARPRLS